jgi:hypothetical protein
MGSWQWYISFDARTLKKSRDFRKTSASVMTSSATTSYSLFLSHVGAAICAGIYLPPMSGAAS